MKCTHSQHKFYQAGIDPEEPKFKTDIIGNKLIPNHWFCTQCWKDITNKPIKLKIK